MLNEKISINELPDDLFENLILPYLSSKDLFYSVRGVRTEWHEMMKNTWGTKIKDEMIDQVKSLDFIYEKEVYTKTYEFKLKYLLNYRNLLLAYNNNANILLIVKSLINIIQENQIKELLIIFFSFCEINSAYSLLIENEIQISNLEEFLQNEENYFNFRMKILDFLDFENINKDEETLNMFRSNFSMLNKELLENLSENAKMIYSFLQGLIEFHGLKIEVKELRNKIENLISRIQEETVTWPRKKKFFEKAYKFLLFSRCTNKGTRFITNLYEVNKIRHPLVDYNDEALTLIFDLKGKLNSGRIDLEEIDEIIFENILARRILLTKKILILDRFYDFYRDAKNNSNTEDEYKIRDVKLNLKQLLWCMKFSSNSEHENISNESVLRTKSYLDDNFDYENHIIIKRENNKIEPKNENNYSYRDYELEQEIDEVDQEVKNTTENKTYTEEDINKLKKQKQNLEEQKQKTEQILTMIKKFVSLKEHMSNNKKKYKLILYVLSRVRKGETHSLNQENFNEVLQDLDIENLDLNDEETLSSSEKSELLKFDNSDVLMKEIEESILKQIETHLSENTKQIEEDNNSNDN